GRAFPRASSEQARPAASLVAAGPRTPPPLPVAGKRARAGERDRARRDPDAGRLGGGRGPSAARVRGTSAWPVAVAAPPDQPRGGRARSHPPDAGALRS